MISLKTIKTAAISVTLAILTISIGLLILLRAPLYFVYKMRARIPESERKILYHVDHKQLAIELRKFAIEQRWNKLEKKEAKADFFYGDDQRLPDSVRVLKPSWVQIDDDQIDVGCGQIIWDETKSFGIRTWRDGLSGTGTKKLAEGMWFYSDDGRVPPRFSFP